MSNVPPQHLIQDANLPKSFVDQPSPTLSPSLSRLEKRERRQPPRAEECGGGQCLRAAGVARAAHCGHLAAGCTTKGPVPKHRDDDLVSTSFLLLLVRHLLLLAWHLFLLQVGLATTCHVWFENILDFGT